MGKQCVLAVIALTSSGWFCCHVSVLLLHCQRQLIWISHTLKCYIKPTPPYQGSWVYPPWNVWMSKCGSGSESHLYDMADQVTKMPGNLYMWPRLKWKIMWTVGFLAYPWSSTTEFNICKQANPVHIFANSHDMLRLKFDLLNSLTGTVWTWHGTQCCRMPCTCTLYLQVYCCAVCLCYGINSGANQRHATATVCCIWALGETINKNNVPQMHWHCDFVPVQQVGIHTSFHHFMKFSQIFNK